MNVYVFDLTGNRPWADRINGIQPLEAAQLSTPQPEDLLIIHSTDYRDERQSNYGDGAQQPYILWVTGGTPSDTSTVKEHFYRTVLPHGDSAHSFWKTINIFIKTLQEENNAQWELLYERHYNHLIALAILCQGYLAAHGGDGLGEEWKKVWEKLPDDLKDKKKPYQLVEEKRNKTKDKNDFWKNVSSRKNIEDELDGNGKATLKPLLDAVYGKESLSVEIVNGAYIALKQILKG